jgi:hypothetical protein
MDVFLPLPSPAVERVEVNNYLIYFSEKDSLPQQQAFPKDPASRKQTWNCIKYAWVRFSSL